MRARVFVTLKPSVFDPQGQDHRRCPPLARLCDVSDVRQGKYFELELSTTEASQARKRWRQRSPTSCSPIR